MNFSDKFKFCPACGSQAFISNNIKSKRCETCGFIYYVNPSAATAAFILNRLGEVLVCRRAYEPSKGTLDLPGGFADPDETIEQCVAREVLEETGGKVNNARFLFSLPNAYAYSGLTVPTLDCFFLCTLEDETIVRANDDVEACFFVPIEDLEPDLFGLASIREAVRIFRDTYTEITLN